MTVRKIIGSCFILAFFACFTNLYGQGPYFKDIELPNRFDDLTIELMTQCNDGFIWIATDQGLFRFDGINFNEFSFEGDSISNDITAIYTSPNDTIWLGYRNGQIAFLTEGHLHLFDPPEGLPRQMITDISSDNSGILWFATYGEGLYLYSDNRLYNIDSEDGLTDNYVYDIEQDPASGVWAASDKGINICSFSNGSKKVEHIGSAQGLPDNIVTSLFLAGDSIIMAGMYKEGVCAIDILTKKITRLFAPGEWEYGEVHSFLWQNDQLWVVTGKKEIIQYVMGDPSYVRIYDKSYGLPDEGFKHITSDDEGNVWIVSNNSKLEKVNLLFEIIDLHEDLAFSSIHALLADRQGHIWFYNDDALIRHSIEFTGRNTVSVYSLPLSPNMQIISLYEDDLGYIWAGTFGQGVYRIDPISGNYVHMTIASGLVDNNVLGISGWNDKIWFATLGGVSHILSGEVSGSSQQPFVTFDEADGLSNNYVYSAHTDSKGNVWFATDGSGIVKLSDGEFTSFSSKTGHIKSSVVYSITEDRNGNIWFSTLKEGIYRYDGESFYNYNSSNGLKDLHISSLIADEKDNLIIANRNGVDILNIKTGVFSYYSEEYGLDGINPDLNTVSVDVNGDIWLGTRKAVIKYTLPDISVRKQPNMVLEEPEVFLDVYDFKGNHSLSAKQNHLTFNFHGLWFQNPEAVTYQYRLEGYDPEWVTTRDNSVIYPNLPHGQYNFMVKASANNSFEGLDIQEFAFTVRPPFWKTWWFMILIILSGASLLYYIIKTRESSVKRKERRDKERVLLEFENLKSQVNPHFLFNSFNSLISVIEEDQEKAVEYVEKLSQFFRNILMYRDEDLITLENELKIIEDYFFIHQQRYDNLVSLDISVPETSIGYMIPPLTLQILIENAIKHNVISKAHPLTISVESANGSITVSNKIKKKRTASTSTGTGLENVKNRYRLLTDKPLSITDGPDEFIVSVPLINNSL